MDKRFLITFAFKNLLVHKLRAILTILGVMVGISAIVFLVSFAFGLERLVTQEVTRGNAYKLIDVGTGNIKALSLNDDAIANIKKVSEVKTVEPTVALGATAKKDNKNLDVTLNGTSNQYMEWSGFKIRWGQTLGEKIAPTSEGVGGTTEPFIANSAFIKFLGTDAPQKYLGQSVSFDILMPKDVTGGEAKKAENVEYVLVGVVDGGLAPNVYVAYQNLIKLGAKNYSQLKVEINNANQQKVTAARKDIESFGFKTQYVGDTVTQIEQIFNVFKIILGSFGLIALIVAALGMFNTLTISLLERTKEIALMKILGMRRRDIRWVFLSESLFLGAFGGILGVGFGVILSRVAGLIFNHFAQKAGTGPINIFYFPLWFLLAAFLFALLVGLLTGLYPARRATRVNALDVLRYE